MESQNLLLREWETPFGSVPFDEIQSEYFLPALKESINIHNEELEVIVNNLEAPTFENTILALEKAGTLFLRVTLIFENLKSAKFVKELKDISEEFNVLSSKHSTQIILNEKLFDRIKEVHNGKEYFHGEDLALLKNVFREFEEAGANCPIENKKEFSEINARISVLKDKFSKNLQDERGKYLLLIEDESIIASMPEDDKMAARNLAEEKGEGGFGFIPNRSLYPALMKYCNDRKVRRKFFEDSGRECCHGGETDNREIVREIVNLRLKRAQLLGFGVHAETVLKNRMLKTQEEVIQQTQAIFDAALPKAKNDVKRISDFAKETEGEDFELMPWDFMFYSEKYGEEKMGFSSSDIKPYFELDRMVEGVFSKVKEMYGLDFSKRKDIPVYNKDVVVYEVLENGEHVGLLYLDLFADARVKSDGEWMTESAFQGRFPKFQRPHVHICTNYSKPNKDTLCLLTQEEVETFLHEFGHALHGLLSDVEYPSLSGTKTSRDFVELPSQVMENFFFEKDFLDSFARHYETKEKLPEELFEKMLAGKNFNKGYFYAGQAGLTMIDNYWHTIKEEFNGDVLDIEKEILSKLDLFPAHILRYRTVTFLHPFSDDYDMGYYSYANAEVLEADMFRFWKENGFSQEVFRLFRECILSKGGSCEEKEMYRNAVGRLPDIESFLDMRIRNC